MKGEDPPMNRLAKNIFAEACHSNHQAQCTNANLLLL